MRGERPLAQTGTSDHKESTVIDPWEYAPHRAVVRTKDNRQGQHNINAICDAFPTYRLVGGIGANLKTLRGSFNTLMHS